MDIQAFLQKLGELFGGQITTILALIVAQVITGVAVALKIGVFEWSKLGDFYRTRVAPLLLGWLAAIILAHFALGPNMPKGYEWVDPTIATIAFGVVVATIAGSIMENFQALGILPSGVSNVLVKAGVPTPQRAAFNEAKKAVNVAPAPNYVQNINILRGAEPMSKTTADALKDTMREPAMKAVPGSNTLSNDAAQKIVDIVNKDVQQK